MFQLLQDSYLSPTVQLASSDAWHTDILQHSLSRQIDMWLIELHTSSCFS